jgi:hypothetical protein
VLIPIHHSGPWGILIPPPPDDFRVMLLSPACGKRQARREQKP